MRVLYKKLSLCLPFFQVYYYRFMKCYSWLYRIDTAYHENWIFQLPAHRWFDWVTPSPWELQVGVNIVYMERLCQRKPMRQAGRTYSHQILHICKISTSWLLLITQPQKATASNGPSKSCQSAIAAHSILPWMCPCGLSPPHSQTMLDQYRHVTWTG